MFTDRKNNRFQKNLITHAEHEYMNMSTPIIELATPLFGIPHFYCEDPRFERWSRKHILSRACILSSVQETKSDKQSRPGPELLFNIPNFLKSLIPGKKHSWMVANDSSPAHPPYSENRAKVFNFVIFLLIIYL